ncbi:hypothetical protein ABIC83_002800 [Roseateles asaccharophilus]|uniref:hypothetical protein n=1 Tax=Roseateles asaccharophilus TaxID=582607 RepID=UPI0038351F8B
MKAAAEMPPANTLAALAHGLMESARHRALGSQGAGRPMQAILRQLIGSPSEVVSDSVEARRALVSGLVLGEFGPGLMMDAIIELEADIQWGNQFETPEFVVDSLIAGQTGMARHRMYPAPFGTDLKEVDGLMEWGLMLSWAAFVRQPWAAATVIDLASGGYGEETRAKTIHALVAGVGPSSNRRSMADACVQADHEELLVSLAKLGLPESLKDTATARESRRATTTAGQWLDILSTSVSNRMSGHQITTFPMLIAQGRMSMAPVLADLLVELDPGHRDIAGLEGTAAHAHITEAFMRRRIQASVGLATETQPTARRSRTL